MSPPDLMCWPWLARHTPEGEEAAIFARLHAVRPLAWPNLRIIVLADEILGGGRPVAALRDHYRVQVAQRPEIVEELRCFGREAEIPD